MALSLADAKDLIPLLAIVGSAAINWYVVRDTKERVGRHDEKFDDLHERVTKNEAQSEERQERLSRLEDRVHEIETRRNRDG